MPWTIDKVEKHKKGLSDTEKKKWVSVANSTLAACIKKGGKVLDCEVTAIRTANGMFSDNKKSAEEYANTENPLRIKDHNETLNLLLSEIQDEEYQLVFPVGTFNTGKYGEVIITETYAKEIEKNWKTLGKDSLFLDKNHYFEEAFGWPEDLKSDSDGVKIKWNFNSKGKELIDDKQYKFFSAAIGYTNDLKTGEKLYPVLRAVTLCNNPVMTTLPQVHLSDTPAHGDGEQILQGGQNMTLKEITEAVLNLSVEDKNQFEAKYKDVKSEKELSNAVVKIGIQDEKIKLILSENQELAKQLKEFQDKKNLDERTVIIEAAIKDGKILPKNKEKWEKLFNLDSEGTTELLKEKGSEVDLSEKGNGSGGSELKSATAEEKAVYSGFGLSDDDIKKYGGVE